MKKNNLNGQKNIDKLYAASVEQTKQPSSCSKMMYGCLRGESHHGAHGMPSRVEVGNASTEPR